MKNKNKMRFSEKMLMGIIIYILLLTITFTIVFIITGSYPVEIYVSCIPAVITEFFILYKLELNRRERNNMEDSNNG